MNTLTSQTVSFDETAKKRAIADLLASARHDADFYVLLVGASLLAAGAIFTDSIPLLIASMIVAPLAMPILAVGLGVASGSARLVRRSVLLLLTACAVAVLVAVATAFMVGNEQAADHYITFSGNRVIAVLVAMVSGAIAAYGLVRPKVGSVITGVAIAVSLMPPLVAAGVGLVPGGTTNGHDALELFLLNVAGILVASSVVFYLLGLGATYQRLTAPQTVKD